MLRQDPKAWEKGFKAGESTVWAPVRCPYSAGTTQAWSWHSGYVEGDAKRQGYSYSRGTHPEEPRPRGSGIEYQPAGGNVCELERRVSSSERTAS